MGPWRDRIQVRRWSAGPDTNSDPGANSDSDARSDSDTRSDSSSASGFDDNLSWRAC